MGKSKDIKEYRNYQNVENDIKNNYLLSRKNQTVDYVEKMYLKYLTFDMKLTFDDIFYHLEKFVVVS